ncbi:MAG: hypothetical protein GKR88_12495 [Flavobacteriaceae bacterium]|nr:MAG: hypothetical protein GKR88_12495 [Flavobacteriaceae bacterium]
MLNIILVSAQSNITDVEIRFQSFQEALKYANEHAININNAVISEHDPS